MAAGVRLTPPCGSPRASARAWSRRGISAACRPGGSGAAPGCRRSSGRCRSSASCAQSRQKVHSKVQIMASGDFGRQVLVAAFAVGAEFEHWRSSGARAMSRIHHKVTKNTKLPGPASKTRTNIAGGPAILRVSCDFVVRLLSISRKVIEHENPDRAGKICRSSTVRFAPCRSRPPACSATGRAHRRSLSIDPRMPPPATGWCGGRQCAPSACGSYGDRPSAGSAAFALLARPDHLLRPDEFVEFLGREEPSATAASFRLVPSAWAFFATFAALS